MEEKFYQLLESDGKLAEVEEARLVKHFLLLTSSRRKIFTLEKIQQEKGQKPYIL